MGPSIVDSPQWAKKGFFTSLVGGTGNLELSQVEIEGYRRLQAALTIDAVGAVTLLQGLVFGSPITPASGGTGIASYTVGALLYASGVTTLAQLLDVAVGNVLLSGGVGVAPAYGKVTPSHVSGFGALALLNTIATALIDNDAVTYAKLQNISATSRVLGRKTAAAGDAEECTLSELLDFIGSAAQGDIFYRGASTWARLGAGTSGQFLKTLGAAANPAWADAASKVVQIVQGTYSTRTTSSSATFADTGLTATITPSSASNKVLVLVTQAGCGKVTGDTYLGLRLLRDAVTLATWENTAAQTGDTDRNNVGTCSLNYLDSPASASALVYKTQFNSGVGIATTFVQDSPATSSIFLIEVTP